MRKLVFCIVTAICTLTCLLIADKKAEINREDLREAMNSTAVQSLEIDLAQIKQKVIIPMDKRKSYLLDEEKIKEYKSLER